MNDLRKNIKLTVTNPGFFVKIAKGCERLLTSIYKFEFLDMFEQN